VHGVLKGRIALLIIDIDHFKKVNDEYVHVTGDQCLIAVASCLKNSVQRIGDTVARYGGEEFAVIIANTDAADCLKIA
jgi:diguanylate cyclase (GGDEF)-like protein